MRIIATSRILLIVMCSGCYPVGEPGYVDSHVSPSMVRAPVTVARETYDEPYELEQPRNIETNGKLLVYGDYLLVNEPRKGIHVYDNSVVASPLNLGFIPVPGNLDIVVKNGYLYANNVSDMVVFNFSSEGIREVYRLRNVITPEAQSYEYEQYGIDPDEFVIIGYENVPGENTL